MARVPASEFQREFGRLRSVAHREAVIVTSHGRDDVVLLSADEYHHLRSLDRRAMHVSELTDEEIVALGSVEIPAEAARYNRPGPDIRPTPSGEYIYGYLPENLMRLVLDQVKQHARDKRPKATPSMMS